MDKDREHLDSTPQNPEEFRKSFQKLTPFAQKALLYLTTTDWRYCSPGEIRALWYSPENSPTQYSHKLSYPLAHMRRLVKSGLIISSTSESGVTEATSSFKIRQEVLETILQMPSWPEGVELPVIPPEEYLAMRICNKLKASQNVSNRESIVGTIHGLRISRTYIYVDSPPNTKMVQIMFANRLRGLKHLLKLAQACGLDHTEEFKALEAEQLRLQPTRT